jgi:hypothetical protein
MATRRRPTEDSSEVRPVDVDGVRTVAIGTVLWAVAFVVLALRKSSLDEQGHGWWLWTCLAGVGLGLLGLEYTRKRRDAIALSRLEEEADRRDDEPLEGADVEPIEEVQALDVGPPVPAPTSRRARRAARTGEYPVAEAAAFDDVDRVDERVDTGELEETQFWDHVPGAGETAEPDETSGDDTGERARRRARRHAPKGGDQSTDSDAAYRGRRARRR